MQLPPVACSRGTPSRMAVRLSQRCQHSGVEHGKACIRAAARRDSLDDVSDEND